jgi:hypothetical protein
LAGWFGASQGWFGNTQKSAVAKTEIKDDKQNQPGSAVSPNENDRAATGDKQGDDSLNSLKSNENPSNSNAENLLNQQNQNRNEANQNDRNSVTHGNEEGGKKATVPIPTPSESINKATNTKGADEALAISNSDAKSNKPAKSNTTGGNTRPLVTGTAGAAVLHEGRNGTVGNGTRPSTGATQNKGSVSPAIAGNTNAGNKNGNISEANNKGQAGITSNKKGNKSSGRVPPAKHTVQEMQGLAVSNDDPDNLDKGNWDEEGSLLASHRSNKKRIKANAASIAEMPREKTKAEIERARWQSTHEAIGFVFGLSIYQNFAISSNLSFSYNSAANKGILLDYLPSVYGQYHINNKMYVQAEIQFNAPQATPNLLLSSSKYGQMVSGNSYYVERNIYLRKLYYFNIPLSFYYSPAKNFYLGTGLQFSSMNSGLAYIEDHFTPNQPSAGYPYNTSQVVSFKKDTLSAKLSKTEFRFMLDLNYNYRWFTAGLRLNQALKDYVNLNFHNAPPSLDKNESLQLYFRFNIWNGRHRGMPMPRKR